jgi:hypothetical protein
MAGLGQDIVLNIPEIQNCIDETKNHQRYIDTESEDSISSFNTLVSNSGDGMEIETQNSVEKQFADARDLSASADDKLAAALDNALAEAQAADQKGGQNLGG